MNAPAGGLQLQDCLPVRGRRGVPQGEVMPGLKIDSRLAISHPDRYIFNLIFSPGRLRRLRRHPLLRRHRHHLRRDQLRVQRQGHRALPAALRLHGRVPVPQLDGHHHAVQLRREKEEIVHLFYKNGRFPTFGVHENSEIKRGFFLWRANSNQRESSFRLTSRLEFRGPA